MLHKAIRSFLSILLLVITLPSLGMNDEIIFPCAKYKITSQYLYEAKCHIMDRGEDISFIAELFFPKLERHINKEFYSNEWNTKLQSAYDELLKDYGQTMATAILISHPFQEIFQSFIDVY